MDATELRIQNYRTALDQSQRYLVSALLSVVALWLLRSPGRAPETMYVSPFGVPVDAPTARLLFFAIHIVTAAMALYSVESAKRVVAPLRAVRDIADALQEYPSLAASPWPGVRLAVPLVSLVLLAWTAIGPAGSVSGIAQTNPWLLLLPLSVHITLLMVLWLPPIGSWSLVKLSSR